MTIATQKRIVIAGTGSGVGKTTTTVGLMAALARRGLAVQGFKSGPDYIDPTYHTAATGRQSRNLDSWMCPPATVKEIYSRAASTADISIIEGVMGLYDGKNPLSNEGSTAELAVLLDCPVLLVVNCQSMARSAAAIVKGFQALDDHVRIVGVIVNKVGSDSHYEIVKAAIEQECGIPVVGYFKRSSELHIPERHLGLVPSIERGELSPLFDQLAAMCEASVDLEHVLALAEAPVIRGAAAGTSLFERRNPEGSVRIAVAKDAAFHFYYPDNLELLEAYGAELVYFSPLAGEAVPEEVSGLYIGGGFPEEFAEQLAQQQHVHQSVRDAIAGGMPTLAECGGYMYLTEQLTNTSGNSYAMAGVLPGSVVMQGKLAALGYREAKGLGANFLLPEGDEARGHEFHYSVYVPSADREELEPAYETKGRRGVKQEGAQLAQLVAGYTHFHFASNPVMAERWIAACMAYAARKA
ncbi:cobyrinic acid a,c-diamide synthase [Paenibacillus sp. BIHB 4019]|uniref:Cobyrinate a,c-diamide synthase n=1 Tax=Paenibacillus sp. BIHB 4019 TaxID=1870819 RepID=A0A1B2DPE1_9BACL|nr:cobyrinic acid a,c-diamide synthase [Paenibacillus sp. BIHB 4019]